MLIIKIIKPRKSLDMKHSFLKLIAALFMVT